MNTNKIIKYVGITLAILLIINIFAFLFRLVSGFGFINVSKKEVTTKYSKKIEIINDNNTLEIVNLDIELGASKLIFKEIEDSLKVDTNNDYVTIKENGNTLKIKEKFHWFGDNNISTIIYVPKGYLFNEIKIKMGAGVFEAHELIGRKIDLELGAGSTNISYIDCKDELEVDTGAGSFNLKDSYINNLDLDMGVGNTTINGDISNADIDAGVGSLNINLNSQKEYTYIINKGLGSIIINGESLSNGRYGNGINTIKIDGGVGKITVNDK